MAWNKNISEAPKGKTITVTKIVTVSEGEGDEKTKVKRSKEFEEHQKETVWLWTKCGKQTMSYWIPESDTSSGGGRWSGLAKGEEPLAWHGFHRPEPFEGA